MACLCLQIFHPKMILQDFEISPSRTLKKLFSKSSNPNIQHMHQYIISGQIIIFHQPRFPWNKGISLTKPPFGVRSCEVAIIWPDHLYSIGFTHCNRQPHLGVITSTSTPGPREGWGFVLPMTDPCVKFVSLHEWLKIYGFHVGKYDATPMDGPWVTKSSMMSTILQEWNPPKKSNRCHFNDFFPIT